jgi:RNA:NAD 2'-phosphotransferase (TPT1/KptA family)
MNSSPWHVAVHKITQNRNKESRMNPERQQNNSRGGGNRKYNSNNTNSNNGNKPANSNAREVTISKQLSYFLRHGAVKEGLKITQDGWILVDEILQHKTMKSKGVKKEEIEVFQSRALF